MKTHTRFRNSWAGELTVWLLIALMMGFQCTPVVWALPRGEQVSHGDVTFTRSGNLLTVEQASGKAIVNYSAFDIGGAETVRFLQPGSSAASTASSATMPGTIADRNSSSTSRPLCLRW